MTRARLSDTRPLLGILFSHVMNGRVDAGSSVRATLPSVNTRVGVAISLFWMRPRATPGLVSPRPRFFGVDDVNLAQRASWPAPSPLCFTLGSYGRKYLPDRHDH